MVPLLASPHLGLGLVEALVILAVIVGGGRYLLAPTMHRIRQYGLPEIFTAAVYWSLAPPL